MKKKREKDRKKLRGEVCKQPIFILHFSQPVKVRGFPGRRKQQLDDKFQTWPDSHSLTGKNTIHLFRMLVAALGGCLAGNSGGGPMGMGVGGWGRQGGREWLWTVRFIVGFLRGALGASLVLSLIHI